ncbi:mucin-1 isoform X1 [Hyalella azteca]|uniref:Mucin-1 isoform X1 n=1 Tax=Hyalella azteca TaxID=294128 RepID=A0A979FQ43_HYAAZ|nr:mucin-1 isoform X1 [Hyalella azteca]
MERDLSKNLDRLSINDPVGGYEDDDEETLSDPNEQREDLDLDMSEERVQVTAASNDEVALTEEQRLEENRKAWETYSLVISGTTSVSHPDVYRPASGRSYSETDFAYLRNTPHHNYARDRSPSPSQGSTRRRKPYDFDSDRFICGFSEICGTFSGADDLGYCKRCGMRVQIVNEYVEHIPGSQQVPQNADLGQSASNPQIRVRRALANYRDGRGPTICPSKRPPPPWAWSEPKVSDAPRRPSYGWTSSSRRGSSSSLFKFIQGSSSSPRAHGGSSSSPRAHGGSSSSPRAHGGSSSSPRAHGGSSSSPRAHGSSSSSPRAAHGGSSSPSGAYGGSSSPSGAYGGSSSPSGAYGGSSSPSGAYGGSSSPSGAYGGSSSPSGAYGGSSSPSGAYGGSSSPSGAYGGSSSSKAFATSSESREIFPTLDDPHARATRMEELYSDALCASLGDYRPKERSASDSAIKFFVDEHVAGGIRALRRKFGQKYAKKK